MYTRSLDSGSGSFRTPSPKQWRCPCRDGGIPIFKASLSPEVLQLHENIGEGACGVVKKGRYLAATVAVKQFLGTGFLDAEQNFYLMQREANMLWNLRHPNILTPYAFTCQPPQIITQYFPLGSLRHNIQKQTKMVRGWKRKLKLLKGIAAGMRCFHEGDHPICHRDLKSQNVLISHEGQAVICDVGLSNFVNAQGVDVMESRMGMRNCAWQPPEVISDGKYSEKSDVYSVGMIMWELQTGKLPFGVDQPMDDLQQISFHHHLGQRIIDGARPETPMPSHSGDTICRGYWDLMRACWSQSPADRPTFAEFDFKLMQLWEEVGNKTGIVRSMSAVSLDSLPPTIAPSNNAKVLAALLSALSGGILVHFMVGSSRVLHFVQDGVLLNGLIGCLDHALVIMALFNLMWIHLGLNALYDYCTKFFSQETTISEKGPPRRSPFEEGPSMDMFVSELSALICFPLPSSDAWPQVRENFLDDAQEVSTFSNECVEHLEQIRSFCEHHVELPTDEEWKAFRNIFEMYPMARAMRSYYQYTHPFQSESDSETTSGDSSNSLRSQQWIDSRRGF